MKPSPRMHPLPPIVALSLLAACLLVWGCGERVADGKHLPWPGTASLPDTLPPAVARDLTGIQADGVLRMITVPGSLTCQVFEGEVMGYEHDLLETFCDNWNLKLEVVLVRPGEDPYRLLNEGRGDVLAMGLLHENRLSSFGAPTRSFERTHLTLVTKNTGPGSDESDGAVVLPRRSWTPLARRLLSHTWHMVEAPPRLSEDDLLRHVARGWVYATVVPASTLRACRAEYGEFFATVDIGEPLDHCWLVRRESPELLEAINRHLTRNLGATREGYRRSHDFGVIYNRYIDNSSQVRYYRQAHLRPDRTGRICRWDPLIRDVSDAYGLDWLLVASLMYQESRFNPERVSSAGAVGLMQIIPRFSDRDSSELHDPRVNIEFGVKHLSSIYDWFDFLDEENRWPFTLATYHAGTGHMNDARRLAMDAGLDPNRWRNNVEIGLRRLRDERHSNRSRYGFYRGDRSVYYAESILRRAAIYRQMLEQSEAVPE